MNTDMFDEFLILIIGVFGYLIGVFVSTLLSLPYLTLEMLNVVGLLSFIPLGIFLGIIGLIFFLSQFKVVRRD